MYDSDWQNEILGMFSFCYHCSYLFECSSLVCIQVKCLYHFHCQLHCPFFTQQSSHPSLLCHSRRNKLLSCRPDYQFFFIFRPTYLKKKNIYIFSFKHFCFKVLWNFFQWAYYGDLGSCMLKLATLLVFIFSKIQKSNNQLFFNNLLNGNIAFTFSKSSLKNKV